MKGFVKSCIPALALILFFPGSLFAYTIQDNYIGAWPNNNSYWGKDIIGNVNDFEISKMDVGFANQLLTVSIYSTYFDGSVGALGTLLGDLFISDNGWKPNRATTGPPGPTGPYPETSYDYYLNGESWEYAVVLSNRGDQGNTGSGTVQLYAVGAGSIGLSAANPGYIYRTGQEWVFNPGAGQTHLAAGTFSYGNGRLDIAVSGIDFWSSIQGFGFHYAMSCANDVIEGEVPIPEPSTVILLGAGLLGLAGLCRKKSGNGSKRPVPCAPISMQ